ncbi:MAG: glycosyltransferase, partial [Planctomycetota bacterium]
LRIVRVIPFFDPATQYGGVVSQARRVCSGLAERGHDVRVVTTDIGVPDGWDRDVWMDRDSYRVFYASTRPWHRVAPYWTPSIRRALDETLRDADVLNLNVGLTLTNVIAKKVAARYGIPYVYNPEGCLSPTRLETRRLGKKLFVAAYEKRVIADAEAIQANTDKDIGDFLSLGASRARIHKIPNGLRPLAGAARSPEVRGKLGISPTARIVLFLGRLHAIKGLELLVESFAITAETFPDLTLVIAGADSDGTRKRAEALARARGISNRVVFTGHVDGEDKVSLLHEADVFALTSHSEGLPNAVLEASASGTPCLLTKQCNVQEVEEFRAGHVCKPDAADLSHALASMLRSDLAVMGENARRMVAERFCMDDVIRELESLYFSIAERSERRVGGALE